MQYRADDYEPFYDYDPDDYKSTFFLYGDAYSIAEQISNIIWSWWLVSKCWVKDIFRSNLNMFETIYTF